MLCVNCKHWRSRPAFLCFHNNTLADKMASSVYMMKEASTSGQSFPPALMVGSVPRTIEAETTARQVRAKKRKIRFAIAGAVAAVVIAVAVAVPVVVIKQKKSNNYRELYFPGPVEGQVDHNLYGVLEGGRTSNSQTYDRLVVYVECHRYVRRSSFNRSFHFCSFGTSYSDNAHARDPAYASSLAPEGYWVSWSRCQFVSPSI